VTDFLPNDRWDPSPRRSRSSWRQPDPDQWVVSLEIDRLADDRPVELADVKAAYEHLGAWNPTCRWQMDHYTVVVEVPAPDALEATACAMAQYGDAIAAVGLGTPRFVRVKVVRAQDSRSPWRAPDGPADAPAPSGLKGFVTPELVAATRALLTATTEDEVTQTLHRFIVAVGGRVELGAPRPRTGMIDLDVSIGRTRAYHAIVPSFSVAGLIIEGSLPTLVADARCALEKVASAPGGGLEAP